MCIWRKSIQILLAFLGTLWKYESFIIHYVATQWKKKQQQLWHLWIVLTENYKRGFCLTLSSQTNTISGKEYFKQWDTLGLLTRRNVFPEKRLKKHLIKNQVFSQSNKVGKNTDSCLTHFFYSTNVCFFLSPASLFFLFFFFFFLLILELNGHVCGNC